MRIAQQHIIDKVFLDIDTRRTQTAYYLKDHLDVFLKDELFPHLERYFETIEDDLPATIVQIPKVSVNLTVKKQSDLKEGYVTIKEKLVAQIDDLITTVPSSNKVLHIDTSESKWRSLHHFLSYGTTPWWKGSKSSFDYTSKDIIEITKSPVFPDQFKSLIQQKVICQRLIYQCTDHELKILLSTAFSSSNTAALISPSFINTISPLSLEVKNHIWYNIIDYVQTQDETALISYIRRQLVQEKKEVKNPSDYAFAKAAILIIKQLLQINPAVVEPLLLKKYKDQDVPEENFATTLLFISDSLDLASESQFLNRIIEQKINKTTIKEDNQKANLTRRTSENKQVLSNYSKQENNSSGANPIANQTPSSTHKNNIYKGQKSNNKKSSDSSLTSQKSEGKTQTPKSEIESTTQTEFPVSENRKRRHEDSELTDSLSSKPASNIEEKQISPNQDITTTDTSNVKQQSTTPQESNEISPKRHQENNMLKTPSAAFAEDNPSSNPQVSSPVSSALHLDDMIFEDVGTYQIQNAGLIIVHPFIKHFFENCKLLDSNQEIINKELAVHALHYIATQKEQQLESDMLFEKMLCGVPIQQPINRHIILSEFIKEQSEELLQAILENWSILKNSSPDLLRSEFLQRPGLLSFKEDNPKITIERKTHDILLDKLPWGIGLCKLPWIEKLIFTDW